MTLLLLTGLIFLIAITVQATFGFGSAIIAMPLLTLVLGLKLATPLFALVSFSMTLAIVMTSWRQIQFQAASQLVLASLVGIPLGVWGIKALPERWIVGVMGVFLILFGLCRLLGWELPSLKGRYWPYGFGLVAGILGAAYNTNGPPIITYGSLCRWPPEQFRATLQGYFLPTGAAILASHGLTGLWTPEVFQLYALNLPIAIVATFIGTWINHHLSLARFERILFSSFILLGGLLLA